MCSVNTHRKYCTIEVSLRIKMQAKFHCVLVYRRVLLYFPLYKNKCCNGDHPEGKDMLLKGYGERKNSSVKHMFLFI